MFYAIFFLLAGVIHAAAAYHQVGVGVVSAALLGELREIYIVAFGIGGDTNIKRVIPCFLCFGIWN